MEVIPANLSDYVLTVTQLPAQRKKGEVFFLFRGGWTQQSAMLSHAKRGKLKCYVYPFSEATLPGTCGAEFKVLALSNMLQFGSGPRFLNFSGKLKFDHDNTLTAKQFVQIHAPFVNNRPASSGDGNEFVFNFIDVIFKAYWFELP